MLKHLTGERVSTLLAGVHSWSCLLRALPQMSPDPLLTKGTADAILVLALMKGPIINPEHLR